MRATLNNNRPKVISLSCFAVLLYIQIVWITIYETSSSHDQSWKVAKFLQFFPFTKSTTTITYLTLLSGVIVLVFASKWQNLAKGYEKSIAILVIVMTFLIMGLTLFQLL